MVNKKKTKKKRQKIKTYKINQSSILKEILDRENFKEELAHKKVDFSAWDTYQASDILADIKFIKKEYLYDIDNKREFYMNMREYDLTEHTPITYPYLSQVSSNMFDKEKIYFLKNIHGSGGKDVFPVKTLEQIDSIVGSEDKDNFILQEEVPNMYLHNGSKTTMRNYALVCDKGIYFYKEGYVYIYTAKHDRNTTDNQVHNTCSVGQYDGKNCRYEKLSKQHYYKKIIHPLCDITSKLLHRYFKDITFKNRYIILGLDFIIDKNYKPYIIEVNAFPNLSKVGEVYVKKKMLGDFVNLYVLPKVNNKRSKKGGWIKI
tara:strand:+ start:3351 stop:4301 length:951 start_codon:yes stop_codon:yes gene_type:complete